MTPDIRTGPLGLAAAAPGSQSLGASSAGPPGSADVSALFAAFLARSGSPPQTPISLTPAPKRGTDAKTTELPKEVPEPITKNMQQLASIVLPGQPMPLLPINTLILLKTPATPQNAGAAVETQNAMDTVPMSVSPKAKSKESQPGGELPLAEARTPASAPLPAFPVFLIPAAAIVPAAAVPLGTVKAQPTLTPAPVTGQTTAPALPMAPALPRTFSIRLPEPAVETAATTAQNRPSPVPKQSAAGNAPEAALAVPAAPAQVPLAPNVVKAAGVLKMPYVIAAQALTAPAAALTEPRPTARAEIAPTQAVTPQPSVLTAKAAPAVPMASASPVPTAAKNLPSLPLTLPGVTVALTAAAPITKAEAAQTDSRAGSLAENPLKTGSVAADNNTGKPILPAGKSTAAALQSQVVGKRSERQPADEKVNGKAEAQSAKPDAATLLPAQTITVPVSADKAAAAPLTQADRTQMVRQAADGIKTMPLPAKPEGSGQQITLQLHPKDWGQLQITVRVVAQTHPNAPQTQTITAHVIAESGQVKAALESGTGALRQTLREAGLHLDRLTVTVQSPGASSQAGTTPGHHQSNSGGSFGQNLAGWPNGSDPKAEAAANPANASSFAGGAGNPQSGRQGEQSPPAYTGAWMEPEPEQDQTAAWNAPQRATRGQIDMRA